MVFFVHVLFPGSTAFSAREDEASEFDEVPGRCSGKKSGKNRELRGIDKKEWKKGRGDGGRRRKRYNRTPGRGSKHGAAHTTCVLADALAKS